ncbi:MAG: hypothetical protein WA005_15775 [Candidatus Binataceae bacterium]
MSGDGADLLLNFEKETLSGDYLRYYESKRGNFRNSLSAYPGIWKGLMLLNEIWMREFNALSHQREPNRALPVQLFMIAHSHFLASIEIGFSGLIKEACNTMRMGMEAIYHACRMLADPALQKAWMQKGRHTEEAIREFEKAFEKNRTKNFETLGLDDLLKHWEDYSEWSHTNLEALVGKLTYEPASAVPGTSLLTRRVGVLYFENDPRVLAVRLIGLLEAAWSMEKVFFDRFPDRLKLDHVLLDKRHEFVRFFQGLVVETFRRFKIPVPTSPPPPRRTEKTNRS